MPTQMAKFMIPRFYLFVLKQCQFYKKTKKNYWSWSFLFAELEAMKKNAEIDRKKIDELTREKELLNKKMLKTAADTTKQQDIVKLHEQSKKNLEHEIQNYKEEAQKQRKLIFN